jgi:calcineurin-like phosphoesterase family protein
MSTPSLETEKITPPFASFGSETAMLTRLPSGKHAPSRTWRNMGKRWVNLHSHSHGRLKPLPHQFEVGIEVWKFRPVQLAELLGMKADSRGPKIHPQEKLRL